MIPGGEKSEPDLASEYREISESITELEKQKAELANKFEKATDAIKAQRLRLVSIRAALSQARDLGARNGEART